MSKIEDLEKRVEILEQKIKKYEEYNPEDDASICAQIGHTWTQIGDLEWSDNLGEMTWDEAVKMAKKLNARLPKRWEMTKAVDEHHNEMQELIEYDEYYTFWSATEGSAASAWYVYLSGGYTTTSNKSTTSYQVRAVRDVIK